MQSATIAFSGWNRQRKADRILGLIAELEIEDLVLVGCGNSPEDNGPETAGRDALVERAVASRARILLACDIRARHVPWPFAVADGRALPLGDQATQMVLANAVIEHVGQEVDQRAFVAELSRVGRNWVITTPNRWFPVESHTAALVLHWLPRWRRNRSEFTRLLSLWEFRGLLPAGAVIHGKPWSPTFLAAFSQNPDTAQRSEAAAAR